MRSHQHSLRVRQELFVFVYHVRPPVALLSQLPPERGCPTAPTRCRPNGLRSNSMLHAYATYPTARNSSSSYAADITILTTEWSSWMTALRAWKDTNPSTPPGLFSASIAKPGRKCRSYIMAFSRSALTGFSTRRLVPESLTSCLLSPPRSNQTGSIDYASDRI
jgi:hypothetical protein